MKGNVVSCVVVLIGLVALSPTGAQAGGASGVGTINTFFVCQSINGANVDAVVTTHEFDDSVINGGIRVGNGVLHCRQVNVTDDSTNQFLNPTPSGDVKCYSIKALGSAARSSITLQDAFFPAGEIVSQTEPPSFLCAPTQPID